MKHRLFVYGTLKKGFPNHDLYMDSAEKLGNYQTLESYPLVLIGDRRVPCMIDAPGEGQPIEGELYEVDDDCLKRIDALEGINQPEGYRRLKVSVRSVGKHTAVAREAYAYLISPQSAGERRSDYLTVYRMKDAKKYRPRAKKNEKQGTRRPTGCRIKPT